MKNISSVQTNEQDNKGKSLLDNFIIGEMNILAEMLNITPHAARARLIRNSIDAIEAAEAIIENRKKLIQEYQSKN